jgi:uncharacterized protein with NAD-binding domain and iron-sulfur cluster
MTAAYRLAKAGRRVLVLEAGSVLGGRTSSWTDGGMPIDSGLHKFLGIYRPIRTLLSAPGNNALVPPLAKLAYMGAADCARAPLTRWNSTVRTSTNTPAAPGSGRVRRRSKRR